MLSFGGLHISSGNVSLVKHISLEVKPSEILSLVGESGSGKSLTCLSVLSLLPANLKVEGRIAFTGKDGIERDLLGMSPSLRKELALKKIAYIFQEPLTALNPVQTCGRQLMENIALCKDTGKKERRELAGKLLKQVDLNDVEKVMKSYPFQLSGGQRQRVMIAMALAGDPELIIADEPTTALDVLLQDEILGLLRKLCLEQGRSVLLVSHDIDAVSRFSDRIAVMYKGEIVETGSTDDILKNARHIYTRALLACKPGPDKKGKYLSTLSDTMDAGNKKEKTFFAEPVIGNIITAVKNTGKIFRSNDKAYIALKDINFNIQKGVSTGLIGESGSGKSTISRILVQLEKADSGEIIYDFENGKPLSSNIQMIFQDPFAALNPALKVSRMLEEVINKHSKTFSASECRKQAAELLGKVGLSETDLEKYPSEFSGGQRQRLCIARALAARPQLLICDESTSALDLSVQAQILNLIKELQLSEQLTVLMITHSMAVAAWFCNYLIVLKDGEIVEQGETDQLLNNPSRDYTRTLLQHIS